jgi:putative hemolysin
MHPSVEPVAREFFGSLPAPVAGWLKPLQPVLSNLLVPPRLSGSLQEAAARDHEIPFPSRMLQSMNVSCQCEPEAATRIPAAGAAVVVANHPFGMLEGLLLAQLLQSVRQDVRIIANSMLGALPELGALLITVNPYGGPEARRANVRAMRGALEWLERGGLIAMFPAGDVSRLNWQEQAVADPPWHPAAARLARLAGCPVVPVYFAGRNSAAFQLGGMIHPRLRTASLVRELNTQHGARAVVRIGTPVTSSTLEALETDARAIEYLRYRTYLLSLRGRRAAPARRAEAPLAEPVPGEAVWREVEALPLLRRTGEFELYLAAAPEIPNTLQEIGRLREWTFRQAGEGTGKPVDIDRFDATYRHLFVWHRSRGEVAGAYRLAASPDILPQHGPRGLYTSTLFDFDTRLFDAMGPAIELGRSFVRPEYQRQFAPLLLLWQGILAYAGSRPECATLFGAVSISNDYSQASRELLAGYMESLHDQRLAPLVKPRHPFRPRLGPGWHLRAASRFLSGLEQLDAPVADLDTDGKGVPVLIRQYLRLGGRTLAVNVDRAFGWALDALIVVDLRQVPRATLTKYMGAAEAGQFLRYHERPVPAAG